jgi:hypothetical protein
MNEQNTQKMPLAATDTIESLQAEYDLFLAENGLPELPADELAYEICLSANTDRSKVEWLQSFIVRWNDAEMGAM